MYCAYDSNKHVVAFHDDYDVVETYVTNIKKSNPDSDLYIGKIKNKKLKKLKDIDKLYLVRYSDTYIQSDYAIYLGLMTDQDIYDNQKCKDVLLKILECNPLSDKERKAIEKTVDVIDTLLEESREFTPTIKSLELCAEDYEQYIYNRYRI